MAIDVSNSDIEFSIIQPKKVFKKAKSATTSEKRSRTTPFSRRRHWPADSGIFPAARSPVIGGGSRVTRPRGRGSWGRGAAGGRRRGRGRRALHRRAQRRIGLPSASTPHEDTIILSRRDILVSLRRVRNSSTTGNDHADELARNVALKKKVARDYDRFPLSFAKGGKPRRLAKEIGRGKHFEITKCFFLPSKSGV
ncbi:hypothetical protein EVAR_100447_1 [Eumeta japonica]|uniref:Uncharacterized protein n=1 Tax=Eumeta variegata TaxID=151549 RepID=A0A4C2A0X5_EUMVA|nr:hypothetical protein EVAR_100447_1 [Eumeta japonica]